MEGLQKHRREAFATLPVVQEISNRRVEPVGWVWPLLPLTVPIFGTRGPDSCRYRRNQWVLEPAWDPKGKEDTSLAKFELKPNSAGDPYWVFKANNGEIVAVSEAYKSRSGAINGINVLKEQARNAEVEDLTQQASPRR